MEDSGVVGSSRLGSTDINLDREALGDGRIIIMASKAVDISHHTRRAIEDLKEITEKFLVLRNDHKE